MIVSIQPKTVNVTIGGQALDIGFGTPVARDYVDRDPYTGEYSVTPGDAEITLQTNGLRMTDNIIINPIPSNYGLITWNGAALTVS